MCERVDSEHQSCGVIVDGQSIFGPGQRSQTLSDMVITLSPATCRQIKLQRDRALGRGHDRFLGRGGKKRSTEIGVQNDSGCVDDTGYADLRGFSEAFVDRRKQRFVRQSRGVRRSCSNLVSSLFQRSADRSRDHRT